MKLRFYATSLVLVLLLSACAGPQIHHGQLTHLDKGLTSEQAISRLGLPPLLTQTTQVGGRDFEFHRYQLFNGMNADVYLLAYEQRRLVFWGYVSEFRRQPDPVLAQAMNQLLPALGAPINRR